MFFYLSKIFWFIANPGNVLMLLFLVGMVLLWMGKIRTGKKVLTFFTLLVLFFTVFPIGHWLNAQLENRFSQPVKLPEKVDGIIVLGGAINPKLAAEHRWSSLNGNVERITAFADLGKRYPQAKLVFTGGSGNLTGQNLKEADVVAPIFEQLGLVPGRVLMENQSRNTYENAVLSKELVRPKNGEHWVLVTSARHMPRAVGVFRKVDWQTIPYPVDYVTLKAETTSPILNYHNGVVWFGIVFREVLGLIAYWATGKSAELFPAP